MDKLPCDKARDNAIEAINNYIVDIEIWDGNKTKLCVDFLYPRNDGHIKEIEIGLSDVRASDGIKIHYDFKRDGYVVEQPYYIEVDKGNYIDQEQHWEETGFFQSWALEDKNKEIKD